MIYVMLLIFGFLTLLFAFQYYLILKSKRMAGRFIDLKNIRPDLRDLFKKEKLLVYFFSPNCNACKYQTPVIESLKKQNFNILSIDISRDLQLARVFGVMGTPSIALMNGNHIKEFFVGYQDESKLIKNYLTL